MHATTPANQHTSLGSRPKCFRREFRQQGSLVNNPTKRRRTTSSHQIKSDGNHPGHGQKRNNRKEIRAGRCSRTLSAAQTLGASKNRGRRSIFTLTVLYAPAKVARKRHVNALKKDARNNMKERGGSTVQTPLLSGLLAGGVRWSILPRVQNPSLTKGARRCTYSLFCHPGTTVRSPRIKASTLLAAT